jgi:hypothetical protein
MDTWGLHSPKLDVDIVSDVLVACRFVHPLPLRD